MNKPKIVIVGGWEWPWYQEASALGLEAAGWSVVRFGWREQFTLSSGRRWRNLWVRLQQRVQEGPTVWRIRRNLVDVIFREQPDFVLFYNVQIVDAKTLIAARRAAPATFFCQYANDDPFSADRVVGMWRNFISSIPFFDAHFAYREQNVADFRRHGARSVNLLRSYFVPEDDFPVPPAARDARFMSDVVFAGHYEDDGRLAMLALIANAGHTIKLFGTGWNKPLSRLPRDYRLRSITPVCTAFGADYRQAICGATAALCFLSKRNRDTYTRRNFQIPAMRTVMISQFTDELDSMFIENEEALFFRSPHELLEKIKLVKETPALRERIAAAGYARVYADGHDVRSRMEAFGATILNLRLRRS
jgi:spore maturation protein CgeB